MQQLATIQSDGTVVSADVPVPEGYVIRKAARAVVTDDSSRVALLHVSKYGYHKLPGGGVENGEDIIAALKREIREEIGCDSEIQEEVGYTCELWDEYQEFQQSYCYRAKVIGKIGEPEFTENERNHGFEVVWAVSLEAAIKMLEADEPQNYEGILIRSRDLAFLRAA